MKSKACQRKVVLITGGNPGLGAPGLYVDYAASKGVVDMLKPCPAKQAVDASHCVTGNLIEISGGSL